MKILALAFALLLPQLPALAQRPDNDARIEVWGLKGETQEEFATRHRARTGFGLEGACVATLEGVMGYRSPGVYIFSNPSSPDSTTMLISIGDVPSFPFPMNVNERRSIALPDSWRTIHEIVSNETAGFGSMEVQIASSLLDVYRRGDTGAVARRVASNASILALYGVSLDSAKVNRILASLADAGSAPVEFTVDIYLNSDSLAYRSLAAHVLRNHLDDPRTIDAFASSLWDEDLGGDARVVFKSRLREAREAGSASPERRLTVPLDGAILAAMLNHPKLELCDLALETLANDPHNELLIATALGGGAVTLKYYLRSKLTKHSEFARDFRSEAIAVLRLVSPIDHGSDPEKWIAWIESFAKR